MEKWFVMRKGAPFQEIAEKFQIHPILARLIRNRDVIGDEAIQLYLNGTIADLYDGMLMKDMDKAVDILLEKIREDKKIRIIGDYDIDGINSTYILLEGIKYLGGEADIDIPERMKDGYGLNRNLIDRAFDDDIDTIITCDNGIAAREEIAYGKSLGMTIIVTDHHEIPYEEVESEKRYILPPADAVIDPKQQTCAYPFKELCGAGVAYKVIEALFGACGKDIEDVDYLMENVAIATVGDVMDLVGENRIFVKQGLEMLKRTNNLGLRALMECTGVPVERLSAYHIGFVIGPCLNASGRLDTAKRALELLCAKTKKEADILAGDLKALNDNRKDMTASAVEEAVKQVEETRLGEDKVLVIYLPDCHESLAGIVAGRVRERYHKPVFILTKAEEGVKGSGRSIESYHMYEELNKCKWLLTKFGGHKLAAGLSLEEENVDRLRETLNDLSTLTQEDLIPKISIDMQMPLGYINEAFVDELELLEPFGKGNVKPVFVEKNIEILSARILGKNKNVLKMQVQDALGTQMDAMYFGDVEAFLEFFREKYGKPAVDGLLRGQRSKVEAAFTYYPGINEYMGQKTVQIIIQNYQ
ncbi:MAG: single-stranded-DNA-specific exonuclease RecJ [Clostridiales bacterium]|nr:single-stranded-DNA-specific exonuclease RecJ [Clostridiales bacterium]